MSKSHLGWVMVLSLAGAAAVARADLLVADSAAEFSAIQGQNNWWYGYYDGDSAFPYSNNPAGDDFESLTIFDPMDSLFHDPAFVPVDPGPIWTLPGYWRQEGTAYLGFLWTAIGQTFMQPTWRAEVASHYAVRRWISEVDGPISIEGILAMFAPPTRTDKLVDGIRGRILLDGALLWDASIAGNDLIGGNFNLMTTVNTSSRLDFVLSANDYDACDYAKFAATISYIPEPASLSLLACLGLLLNRRRLRSDT